MRDDAVPTRDDALPVVQKLTDDLEAVNSAITTALVVEDDYAIRVGAQIEAEKEG